MKHVPRARDPHEATGSFSHGRFGEVEDWPVGFAEAAGHGWDFVPVLRVQHGVFFQAGHDQPAGAAADVCGVEADYGAEAAAGVLEAGFGCGVEVVGDGKE